MGQKFFFWATLMIGMDLKIFIVPFWLVGPPSVGFLLPQNFELFPSVLLAGPWPVSSFPKILYCSLLVCWLALGWRPPSTKFCIGPFWLVGWPSAGILLPQNFELFPPGLLAGLRPASSFPKILYCSLLEFPSGLSASLRLASSFPKIWYRG